MIVLRAPKRRESAPGFVWGGSGTSTPDHVRGVFGPRPFAPHVSTVGYDNDFHRGCDLPIAGGNPVHAVVAGSIIRLTYAHFSFETPGQLAQWVEVDPGNSAAFSHTGSSLRITGSRVGAQTFAQSAIYAAVRERVDISSDDWEIRWAVTNNPAVAGGVVGVGFYDPESTEYVALEYNGATFTVRGAHAAGIMANDGATATATVIWQRITYTKATDTIAWQYTADAEIATSTAWTTIASQAAVTFSREGYPAFAPMVYWRSLDANAATETFDLDFVGWVDGNSIGRFGNWVEIGFGAGKVLQLHMQELSCAVGDIIEAGQVIGVAGNTGFDFRSGPVLQTHCHVEYTPVEGYLYGNDQPINPLAVGVFPRTNISNNITVAPVSSADDPDGAASWLVSITVARADQDFDVNEISLTGDVATRTINFDTRAGLNADNDIPKNDGVYYVARTNFDENSPTYQIDVYFNKSTIGTTFTSAYVKDCVGVTLWSSP